MSQLKQLLNSLTCPICKAPIDISFSKTYNYCRAMNYDHYTVIINDGILKNEKVHIYDDKYQYVIINHLIDNVVKTEIIINEIDQEGRVLFSFNEKRLDLDKRYFDFRNFNVNKAVNRIKTICLFL